MGVPEIGYNIPVYQKFLDSFYVWGVLPTIRMTTNHFFHSGTRTVFSIATTAPTAHAFWQEVQLRSSELEIDINMRADVNADGTVNILDLTIVAQNFGKYIYHHSDPADPRADVDGNRWIEILDLVLVAQHLGTSVK